MIDIDALRTYLATNYPTEIEAQDADGIYAALSATGGTTAGSVTPGVFATWAASGPRAVIEDHATNPASPLRASALALRDFLAGSMPVFDIATPAVGAMLDAWEMAGAITVEQHDALIALAQKPVTVAEMNGFPGLTITDVKTAMWLDDGTRAI